MGGYSDLENGINGDAPKKFPYPIFGNCLPQIDVFDEDGYTKEELKMVNETRKILHNDNMRITATTVRVPVFHGHSESINVEFEKDFDLDDLKKTLADFPRPYRNGRGENRRRKGRISNGNRNCR